MDVKHKYRVFSSLYINNVQFDYQHMKHFVWLSTPMLDTELMLDRSGNVQEVVPDIGLLGSAS